MMLMMAVMDRPVNTQLKLVDMLFGCQNMMNEAIGKPEGLVDKVPLHLMFVCAVVDNFEERFDKFELQLMAVIAYMYYS